MRCYNCFRIIYCLFYLFCIEFLINNVRNLYSNLFQKVEVGQFGIDDYIVSHRQAVGGGDESARYVVLFFSLIFFFLSIIINKSDGELFLKTMLC